MGFYYFSIFSLVPLVIAYAVLGLAFFGIARVTRNRSWQKPILVALAVAFAVLPVAEELWIAWRFGHACKEAGTFVYRRVQVDGFYDDTAHWWRQIQDTNYQFVESRDKVTDALWRVERSGAGIKHYRINAPSARYHYKWPYMNVSIAYKVDKTERVVVDSETGELLARETRYGRQAPWYFVGLDRPVKLCLSTTENSMEQHGSIYNLVLEPNLGK